MTSSQSSRSADVGRLAHIDCLRAIAATAVAIHHFLAGAIQLTGDTTETTRRISSIFYATIDLGRSGVLLFFIISGYCIANSILRPTAHPVSAFAVNRIARIFPAYWLSLVLGLAVYGGLEPRDLAASIVLIQYFTGGRDLLGIYWTLAIELTFYALCIALFIGGFMKSLRRLKLVWCILIGYCALAAIARGTFNVPAPYAIPWFLSLMIGGAILRRIDDGKDAQALQILGGFATTFAIALLISLCIYNDPGAYDKTWQLDFLANASAICLFAGINYGYRIRYRILTYLGCTSYSIYLFHLFVFEAVSRLLGDKFMHTGIVGALFIVVACLAATFGVAALIYKTIELPGIQLGRIFVRRLDGLPFPHRVTPE